MFQIERDERAGAARSLDVVVEFFQPALRPCHGDDMRALTGKAEGNRAPDAPRGACDNGGPPGKALASFGVLRRFFRHIALLACGSACLSQQ